MPSSVLFQIGIRLDFSAEIGCISISSSFAIREHLNDREGHPAYTYVSHFEDISALYVHIKGPCLKASILKLKTTSNAFVVKVKYYLSTGVLFVSPSLLFKFSLLGKEPRLLRKKDSQNKVQD